MADIHTTPPTTTASNVRKIEIPAHIADKLCERLGALESIVKCIRGNLSHLVDEEEEVIDADMALSLVASEIRRISLDINVADWADAEVSHV